MKLPQDIQSRLERRWLARLNQQAEMRKSPRVLNESEVTNEKLDGAKHNDAGTLVLARSRQSLN